jgi:7-cyano-7-deazaguanine synthase
MDGAEERAMAELRRPAVVLLSGGLDSTTVLAIAKAEGFAPHALSFRYGQRHQTELEAARRVAAAAGVPHRIVGIELGVVGGSALTDAAIEVPKDRDEAALGADIPVTYVPARNTVFLSIALGYAETLGCGDLFVGVNALDYSGYPDCRPEFIEAFERLAQVATADGVSGRVRYRVHAPLMTMTKAQIIRRGTELGVDYGLTHSCYDPSTSGLACGRCDSCVLRHRGFVESGVPDPTAYVPAR